MDLLPADQVEELKQAFAACDANKDGVITQAEFLSLVVSFDPAFTEADAGVQVRTIWAGSIFLRVRVLVCE
jgi:Ca2+-binding EF-hand superfamily protein